MQFIEYTLIICLVLEYLLNDHCLKAFVVNFVTFVVADESYMECDLVALTNQGEVHVYSVPSLRRQMKYECIKRDDGM